MIPLTPKQLVQLAVQSLSQPKEVMRQVLTFTLDRNQMILIALLLVVAELIIGLLLEILLPGVAAGNTDLSPQILEIAAFKLLNIFGSLLIIYFGGKAFGGQGSLDTCFKMVLWLNFVFLLLQFALPVAGLFAPRLQGMVLIAIAVLSFVQIVAYVMVVHGFTKTPQVIFGVVAAEFISYFFLTAVAAALGLNFVMGAG